MEDSAETPSGLFERYANKNTHSGRETNSHIASKISSVVQTGPSAPAHDNLICLNLQNMSETEAEWILDSGASRHFTYDINDFVEYETITSTPVRTATSYTSIIGKGTVILTVNGTTVRISPVYHIPDLTSRLLSLGQFLKSGLHSRGSAREISLQEEENIFLSFYPRHENDNIYVIRSLVGADINAQIKTIYSIDFEVMHC